MSDEYYAGNDYQEKCCEAKVSNARTLAECSNEAIRPVGINGPVVAKIPVVIAEPRIQIDVEAEIKLEEPALEIKRIKKNLFLNQCKLINIGDPKRGKLFISGFIRKNIEFATAKCKSSSHKGGISGDIRHTTVNVPFECVTKVEFENPPIFCKSGFTSETEIFSKKIETCDPCDHNIIGRNLCEQDFKNFECFTEQVFCELEDVKIFEEDIRREPVPLGCDFPTEQVFEKFVEKMVIFVKIKLLQKQQVNIPNFGHNSYDKKHDDYSYDKKHDDYSDGKKYYDYMEKWPWLKYGKSKKKNKHGYNDKNWYMNKCACDE